MKNIITLLSAVLIINGCSKHPGDIIAHEEIPSATLSIYSPVENAAVAAGDSVYISAKAISEATIHGYDIAIKKLNDTTTYFFKHVHDHNDTLAINQHWKNTVSSPMAAELVITLVLDHDGHTMIKKVPFKL